MDVFTSGQLAERDQEDRLKAEAKARSDKQANLEYAAGHAGEDLAGFTWNPADGPNFEAWAKRAVNWWQAVEAAGLSSDFFKAAERLGSGARKVGFPRDQRDHRIGLGLASQLMTHAAAGDLEETGAVLRVAHDKRLVNAMRVALAGANACLGDPGYHLWCEPYDDAEALPTEDQPEPNSTPEPEPFDHETWLGPKSPAEWRQKFGKMKDSTFRRYRTDGKIRTKGETPKLIWIHRDDVAKYTPSG